ncbi:MAG: hypothetical protein RLQ73_02520 [Hoeflea sp. D1-CHI-28]
MDRLVKTATEARQAAFAARSQTDPENFGEIIVDTLDHHLGESFVRLVKVGNLLNEQTQQTNKVLEKAEEDKWAILDKVRDRERKVECLKRNLPWFGLGAVVLALVLAAMLPLFHSNQRCHMRGLWRSVARGRRWVCLRNLLGLTVPLELSTGSASDRGC